MFDAWSNGGAFNPDDPRTGMDYIFARSEICEGTTWDEAIKRGVVPIKRNGPTARSTTCAADVDFTRPLYPNAWQVEGKESWPTLTGRQQFYLDHEWYLAAGEALPVHKAPPAAGGSYPLRMTGGHTRWSIHTIWRSEADHAAAAARRAGALHERGRRARPPVADNDRVRIFNDVGAFECVVKVAPSVQPGQVIIYHAWENFQFARHKGQQEPIVGPGRSLHLAGDYGQLHYRALYGAPNFGPRGVTVDVQKV